MTTGSYFPTEGESVTCNDPAHVQGCPCRVGGDIELRFVGGPFVSRRLNALRCATCGHRMDDMAGCDSCEADREALEREDHEELHPDEVEGCERCDSRAERSADHWYRAMATY